jgi:flagella basal body P-ring formation protein FlgA
MWVLAAALGAAATQGAAADPTGAPTQTNPAPQGAHTAVGTGETVVAARPIRARSVIGPDDVTTVAGATPGALDAPDLAVGMEARTMLGQGRPIAAADLAPPAFVDRNQIVTMVFRRGGLSITAEGRAMARAAEGEAVKVMNLDSRATVTGVAVAPGTVAVR